MNNNNDNFDKFDTIFTKIFAYVLFVVLIIWSISDFINNLVISALFFLVFAVISLIFARQTKGAMKFWNGLKSSYNYRKSMKNSKRMQKEVQQYRNKYNKRKGDK